MPSDAETFAETLRSTLQSLLTDEMGWALRFPNHEDGSELQPFIWDESVQGLLNPLNLLRSKNWLRPIESAQVLAAWLQPEQVGAVNGAKWLIPDEDKAGILIDPATQTMRQHQYETLLQSLQSELADRQAVVLSHDEEYRLVVLFGQVATSEAVEVWIGIAPVVPIATPNRDPLIQSAPLPPLDLSKAEIGPEAAQLTQRIQDQIDRLGNVKIYGYYGGGYNQIHNYHLVQASGKNADRALERTLIQAGLLTLGQFERFLPAPSISQLDVTSIERLNQWLRQELVDCQVYQLHFWNQEQVYVVGRSSDGIWAGVELSSRFTYNP